jgi:hypothetical protein
MIPKNYRLEDEVKKVREHHEKISNIVKNECEIYIINLIDIENEIKEIFNEFNYSLSRLICYPEYSNMNCEYLFPKS